MVFVQGVCGCVVVIVEIEEDLLAIAGYWSIPGGRHSGGEQAGTGEFCVHAVEVSMHPTLAKRCKTENESLLQLRGIIASRSHEKARWLNVEPAVHIHGMLGRACAVISQRAVLRVQQLGEEDLRAILRGWPKPPEGGTTEMNKRKCGDG